MRGKTKRKNQNKEEYQVRADTKGLEVQNFGSLELWKLVWKKDVRNRDVLNEII